MHQEDAASVFSSAHGEFERARETRTVESVAREDSPARRGASSAASSSGVAATRSISAESGSLSDELRRISPSPRAMAAAGVNKIAEMRTRNLPIIMTPKAAAGVGRELAKMGVKPITSP